MENQNNNSKKCSLSEHKEIDAIMYCQECKILMCNKCDFNHSNLFKLHHKYKLDKDNIKDIFTGFCKEENHLEILEFFCKTHNTLCCASCLCKIKKKSKGQHHDCDVCIIEEIKDKKKNELNDNIKYLDDLSKNLEKSLNDMKNIFKKFNEDKEKLKIDIQNVFTRIRNIINKREDQLLLEVDKQFDNLFFKEEVIKEFEKLPNKIKLSLENGKKIMKDWNENKLNCLINDCLNLEINIKDINKIEKIVKKAILNNSSKFVFTPKEDEINKLIDSIKIFGKINNQYNYFPSEILNNNEDNKNLILSWLPKRPNKITLLLNSQIDGDSCKTLIEKCKGKTPTLVVIKTIKDIIFGGYTNQEWNNKEKDDKAFVYSLKTKKKYKVKIPEYAIHASSWWGFGPSKNTIILHDNCLSHSDNWVGDGAYDIPQAFELNGGEKYFGVKSFEIFHLG